MYDDEMRNNDTAENTTENTTEHISTSRSPAPMEKDSVIHKKYMPTAAITALIQMLMPIFFFKNSPINGTIMI